MATPAVNGSTDVLKKAMRGRTISWQEEAQEADIEVPGTPKTPRTSTTPGTIGVVHSLRTVFKLNSKIYY